MNFNSLQFVAFLAIILVLFWTTKGALRRAILLLASYVFYALWDWRFLALVMVITAVTYGGGLALGAATTARRRTQLVVGAIVADLVVLGLFKYFGFFVDSFVDLLDLIGIDADGPALRLILPIGISFYVFESISYLVDIKRELVEPHRDPVRVALFLSYFPKALAGPIERPRHLLPQLDCAPARPRRQDIGSGLLLILLGLVQKVVLADLAAPIVNDVYGDRGRMSAPALIGATWAFAIQIYGDFAGYTNMARGVSRLFGIDLIRNFMEPYLSSNPVEFWRRWHISLSTWLRDYVYIPLGGNRMGPASEYRNLMLTMLLGGLWHGASWTFVIWGGLQGIYLVGHRVLVRRHGKASPNRSLLTQIVVTFAFFQLICIGWVFFRSVSLDDALTILTRIFTLSGGRTPVRLALVPILMGMTLVMDLVLHNRPSTARFLALAPERRALVCAAAAVAVIVASGGQGAPFIYFAF